MPSDKQTTEKRKAGRPFGTRKYTPDQLATAVQDYLKDCEKNKQIPLQQELALRLGITRETLNEWQTLPEYSYPLKMLKLNTEVSLVRGVAEEGKPIGKMFLLKANHGYVEKQHDTNLNITLNMGQILDQLETAKPIRSLPPEDYTIGEGQGTEQGKGKA